ncbi:hypothetical protein ACG2F4_17200 [Halalkalibaculum sp. DA3122]|uniref:hypothetical protein n=1 Tax=Halalkalibaculum sp. DA3122 TaxID=3373607 RepID=UPI0037551A7C
MIAALSLIILGCNPGQDTDSESHDHMQESDGTHTVTGKLSGFDCAVVGSLCPTTHRGADYTTGVYTEDGSFYFVVNIPQSFLRQHFLETVEVEGTVYDPYEKAVEPEAIHLVEDDDRRLVYEAGYFIDENNGRATFQEGTYRNGRWIAE